jgi:hypothetical protein
VSIDGAAVCFSQPPLIVPRKRLNDLLSEENTKSLKKTRFADFA